MRVCASYLQPRPVQRVSIRLAVLQQNFPAFTQCLSSSRACRFSLYTSTRKFSTPKSHLNEPTNLRWNALRPPGESEKAQAGKRSSPGVKNGKETDKGGLRPPKADAQNPNAWILLLERFLPAQSTQSSVKSSARPVGSNQSCADILAILHGASSMANSGTDLLSYLGLRQGRWQAALDLSNVLLQHVAANVPREPAKTHLPGLSWPRPTSLDDLCSAPIAIDWTDTTSKAGTTIWDSNELDPRYLDIMSTYQDHTMTQIWKSLGCTIIEAADLEGEQADAAMRFVYRIIAQIHKLGLVPDNVYTYVPSNYTTSVQRPPIMHLLSSRMLTTLSDAVWRAHQDDVIAEAVKSGIGYKDLGHDPPGGRFRLKVRPLGPELWLEFVLWCCVDGGFASAGTKIIENLRQRIDRPWFAVNWMLPSPNSSTALTVQSATVDWSRVLLRTGGTVGRIEGYSAEPPFAVMDPRTISAEVVLALVDSLTNSLNVGIPNRGSSLAKVQRSIKNLLSFLEPHRLPSAYFDYLAVRLHQSGSCDLERHPEEVQSLAETFLHMRSLEIAEKPASAAVSFSLEAIGMHSELLNGLFHQSLEASVNLGDVRRALDIFAEIQQLVDSSKLQSMSLFLSTPRQHLQGFFSSRSITIDKEFVVSHGQLPLYKLAAFLDLVTDSGLGRLGNWLLYSEDVDGPLIPESSYGVPCISPALIRFAAVSQDQELTKKVFKTSRDQPLLPSVALFRSLANTNMALSQYTLVHRVLQRLGRAKAGGFRAVNLASLAAGILSLETRTTGSHATDAQVALNTAQEIMHKILEGFYNGNAGIYRDSQRALLHRQVASILRILECIPETSLGDIAQSWRSQFESGNDITLYTEDFNVLLSAIVETKGAKCARLVWDLFCEDPRYFFDRDRVHSGSELFTPPSTTDDKGEWEHGDILRSRDERSTAARGHRHIPLVEVEELPIEQAEDILRKAHTSDPVYEDAVDPSRPTPDESISFDAELTSIDLLRPPLRTGPEFESIQSPPKLASIINPVVRPSLRTLRLIVRGALNERRTRQALEQDSSDQQEILNWSKQFFRAFGMRGQAIQEEVQSLSDLDDQSEGGRPSLAEEKRLYNEARRRLRLREPRVVNVSPKFLSGSKITKSMPPLVRTVGSSKESNVEMISWDLDQGRERSEQ